VIHQSVFSDELNNNNGNEAVNNRLILITAQTTEGKGNDVTRVRVCYNTKHAVLFVTNEDYLNEHQEPGWSLAMIRGECAPLRLCGEVSFQGGRRLSTKKGTQHALMAI